MSFAGLCLVVLAIRQPPASALPDDAGARAVPRVTGVGARRTRGVSMPVKLALRPFTFSDEAAVSPVEFGLVASGFGYRRARLRRRRQFHAGIDFRARYGTAVLAARRGVVRHVASESDTQHGFLGYGNAVVVHHPDTDDFTLYAHLSAVLVVPGQMLVAGEKLGRVGNTNNQRFRGMTSHLHFEVRQRDSDGAEPFPGPYRDNAVDPLPWLVQHGMPLGVRRAVGLAYRPDAPAGEEPLARLEALEDALASAHP
ncbi:MAG: M23 family metallopeptidase [Polyangiales bacterium]|nr:M23 family metallopeptidase [Myxococcales bacterium]